MKLENISNYDNSQVPEKKYESAKKTKENLFSLLLDKFSINIALNQLSLKVSNLNLAFLNTQFLDFNTANSKYLINNTSSSFLLNFSNVNNFEGKNLNNTKLAKNNLTGLDNKLKDFKNSSLTEIQNQSLAIHKNINFYSNIDKTSSLGEKNKDLPINNLTEKIELSFSKSNSDGKNNVFNTAQTVQTNSINTKLLENRYTEKEFNLIQSPIQSNNLKNSNFYGNNAATMHGKINGIDFENSQINRSNLEKNIVNNKVKGVNAPTDYQNFNKSNINIQNIKEQKLSILKNFGSFSFNFTEVLGKTDDSFLTGELSFISQTHFLNQIENLVFESVRIFKNNGISRIQIKLEPENLGQLNIEVLGNGLEISILFKTSKDYVNKLLQENIQNLKDSIVKSGLSINSISIETSQQNEKGLSDLFSMDYYKRPRNNFKRDLRFSELDINNSFLIGDLDILNINKENSYYINKLI